jgi:hypothetical protein
MPPAWMLPTCQSVRFGIRHKTAVAVISTASKNLGTINSARGRFQELRSASAGTDSVYLDQVNSTLSLTVARLRRDADDH